MAQYDLTQLMSLTDLSKKDNVFLSYTPPPRPPSPDKKNELSIFSLELINQHYNYNGPIVTIIDPANDKNTLDLYYTKETAYNYLPSGGDLTDSNNQFYLGNYIDTTDNVTLVKWYDQSGNNHHMSSFIPENRPSISLDSNFYLQVDFAPVNNTPTFLNVTDTEGGPIPSFAFPNGYTVICQYNSIASGGGICAYGLNQSDNPFNPKIGDNSSTVNNFILNKDSYFENSFNYDQQISDNTIQTDTFVGAKYTNDSKYSGRIDNDYTQNNNSLSNLSNLSVVESTNNNNIIKDNQSYNPSSYNFIIFTYYDGGSDDDNNDNNFNIYNVVSTNDVTITVTVTNIQSTGLTQKPDQSIPFFDFHLIGAYKNLGTFNLIEDNDGNGQLYNLITFQRALTDTELQKYISDLIQNGKLLAPPPPPSPPSPPPTPPPIN